MAKITECPAPMFALPSVEPYKIWMLLRRGGSGMRMRFFAIEREEDALALLNKRGFFNEDIADYLLLDTGLTCTELQEGYRQLVESFGHILTDRVMIVKVLKEGSFA